MHTPNAIEPPTNSNFEFLGGPWLGLDGPSGHYVGPHGRSSTRIVTKWSPKPNLGATKGFPKKSKCEKIFRCHQIIAYTTTILGRPEGPWHGLHRPSGRYLATGGHIAYMHPFSVKLVIASLR